MALPGVFPSVTGTPVTYSSNRGTVRTIEVSHSLWAAENTTICAYATASLTSIKAWSLQAAQLKLAPGRIGRSRSMCTPFRLSPPGVVHLLDELGEPSTGPSVSALGSRPQSQARCGASREPKALGGDPSALRCPVLLIGDGQTQTRRTVLQVVVLAEETAFRHAVRGLE